MLLLDKINIYLFLSLPLLLVTGPLLSDLAISIIAITALINFKKIIKAKIINNFFKIFFIFCIYIITRSLFSDYPLLSLESSLFYFRFGLFSLMIITKRHSTLRNNSLLFSI